MLAVIVCLKKSNTEPFHICMPSWPICGQFPYHSIMHHDDKRCEAVIIVCLIHTFNFMKELEMRWKIISMNLSLVFSAAVRSLPNKLPGYNIAFSCYWFWRLPVLWALTINIVIWWVMSWYVPEKHLSNAHFINIVVWWVMSWYLGTTCQMP